MLKRFSANHLTLFFVLAFGLLAFIEPAMAFNTNAGTEFQTLLDRVVGWVTGVPGIIAAIAFGVIGVFRAFQTGQMLWFFAGILVAIVMLLIPTIAQGLGFVF